MLHWFEVIAVSVNFRHIGRSHAVLSATTSMHAFVMFPGPLLSVLAGGFRDNFQ